MNAERKRISLCAVPVRPLLGGVIIFCSLMFLTLAGADAKSLQKAKLIATDGETGDHFGIEVAISGDYAIVGAACDDDKGVDAGSAYIFRWDGSNWVQQQKLFAPDTTAGDWYGCAVSICGDYAIVGARYGDSNALDSGTAYVYWRNGDNWVQQAKLIAEDVFGGACFGIAVSINGNKAIVGAFCDRGIGSAYIFRREGTRWKEQQKLVDKDSAPGDSFGKSVSIDGNTAIVGAEGYDDRGLAYIFKWNDANWVIEQKLTPQDIEDYDWFGKSVSISKDKVIVGSHCDDDLGIDSGSVYIFKRDGSKWVLEQKLTASDGANKDWFGFSVSLSGDYAIIGASDDDDNGADAGSAYIFKWDGSKWVQRQKLTASDGNAQDWFGRSVFIKGDEAIVGAVLDDDKGSNSGSAYIFMPIGEP